MCREHRSAFWRSSHPPRAAPAIHPLVSMVGTDAANIFRRTGKGLVNPSVTQPLFILVGPLRKRWSRHQQMRGDYAKSREVC